jgi:hypothetical protein
MRMAFLFVSDFSCNRRRKRSRRRAAEQRVVGASFWGSAPIQSPKKVLARRTPSVEELDRDLRRHLFQGAPHFLSRICEPVRVDIDTDVAALAAHVIAKLKASDRLLEFVSAVRTLEFDRVRIAHSAAPLDLVVCVSKPENAALPPRNGHPNPVLVFA